MDKFIYAVYLVISTTGLWIGVQFIWSLVMHRKVRILPLFWFTGLITLVGAIFLWERQDVNAQLDKSRRELANAAQSPIYIAGVWPADEPAFFDAMRKAVQALNDGNGVTIRNAAGDNLTVQIELVEFQQDTEDDQTYLDIAEDRRLIAVVGHRNEAEAVKASAAYQESGLLYLAPTVSRPQFSEHGFDLALRLIPDDDKVARRIAGFVTARAWRNVVLLTPQTDVGKNMARYLSYVFRIDAEGRDRTSAARIVMYRSYHPDATQFHELVTHVEESGADVIVIADGVDGTAGLVRALRVRNIETPVIGFPINESQRFFDITEQYSNAVFIASMMPVAEGVAMTDTTDPNSQFVAAQADDAVSLLSQAWERAGTIDPRAVAAVLRAVPQWQGRFGPYDFTPSGDIVDRAIQMKQSQQGRFVPARNFLPMTPVVID